MSHHANEFQLKHLISLIQEDYSVFGPKKLAKHTIYSPISRASEIEWGYKRSVMSFKKFLFPDGAEIGQGNRKLAIVGMPMCDIAAINIFLKQFAGSGLIPPREDLIIVGSDCEPDDNCFCNVYDFSNSDFDLFISRDSEGYIISSKGWRGKELIEKCGLKKSTKSLVPNSKAYAEKLNLSLTKKNIDNKRLSDDFWAKISNNCFGCGACSTVCPLCFCFRQDYRSCPDGKDKKCLNWDSCFSADFSQIQYGNDMRPTNKDRLYNWYHHKFVRGPKELGDPLCVGCGRCITACPAHLSIHNIIHTLNKKFPDDNVT